MARDEQISVPEAMQRAPRADYLPTAMRSLADEDRPLSIGDGVTNSQPSTVRTMLELLDVRPGQRVLDVGSGSGWTTAILAHLVGPSGAVLAVEIIERLVRESGARLRGAGLAHTEVRLATPESWVRRTRRRSTGSSSPPRHRSCRRRSSRSSPTAESWSCPCAAAWSP